MPWHAGAVVLNADFYKSMSKNILFEICEPPHLPHGYVASAIALSSMSMTAC